MRPVGYHTREEIFSQPGSWVDALDRVHEKADELAKLFSPNSYDQIIFTGCGSTHYLSLAAAPTLQELTGSLVRGLPASEIWLNPKLYIRGKKNLLIAVSRSGQTSETLQACETFRSKGYGEILTLSCYPEKPLSRLGSCNLVFPSAQEMSVAQTCSFTSLYLATVALSCIWADGRGNLDELFTLATVCQQLLSEYDNLMQGCAQKEELSRFTFLGSGLRFGLACEAMLKMKEMSLSHSEAFPFLEFRHGPMSMVTNETLVVGLLSEKNFTHEFTVLEEMHNLGAKIMAISPVGLSNDAVDYSVTLPDHPSDRERGVLYLPLLQLLAYYRSLHNGLDPDNPRHLSSVVTLDNTPS
jgi:glucosamine--fructose-6-phosphate aminotransferase (isomerizing)